MPYIGIKSLPLCKCGGKPKIERHFGWWHIECRDCGEYPVEYLPGSKTERIYGWNTRNEAISAWNKANATEEGEP